MDLKPPEDILTKELLEDLYVRQKKSVVTIAKELNIKSHNSICQYIKKYGLQRERLKVYVEDISKEFLEREYVTNKKGIKDIAKILGTTNKSIVRKALILHKIPIRQEYAFNEKQRVAAKSKRTGFGEISGRYWRSVIYHATLRDISFDLEIEEAWNKFVGQQRKCALTGQRIRFYEVGEDYSTQTASLDRIDSTKGYSSGNIQWVDKKIQRMKAALAEPEFFRLCKLIAKQQCQVNLPVSLKDNRNEDSIKFDARTAEKYSDRGTVLHFALRLGFFPNTEEEAENLIQRLILEREYYETYIHLHHGG